jgi:hypothetical protein
MHIQLFELVLNYTQGVKSAIRIGRRGSYVADKIRLRIPYGFKEEADVFVRAFNTIKRSFGLRAHGEPACTKYGGEGGI